MASITKFHYEDYEIVNVENLPHGTFIRAKKSQCLSLNTDHVDIIVDELENQNNIEFNIGEFIIVKTTKLPSGEEVVLGLTILKHIDNNIASIKQIIVFDETLEEFYDIRRQCKERTRKEREENIYWYEQMYGDVYNSLHQLVLEKVVDQHRKFRELDGHENNDPDLILRDSIAKDLKIYMGVSTILDRFPMDDMSVMIEQLDAVSNDEDDEDVINERREYYVPELYNMEYKDHEIFTIWITAINILRNYIRKHKNQ